VIIIKADSGRIEEVAFTGESPAERAIKAAKVRFRFFGRIPLSPFWRADS
jgi:hypothetical protein